VRPSLRFLLLAVAGWGGVRAWTTGAVPAEMFTPAGEARALPPIATTEFPPIDPVEPAVPMLPAAYSAPTPQAVAPAATPAMPVRYVQAVIGVPVAMGRGVVPVYRVPAAVPAADPALPPRPARLGYAEAAEPTFYSPLPPLEQWPLASIAALSQPFARSSAVPNQSTPIAPLKKLDRVQVAAWALLRGQQGQVLGPSSLASGGQLGGSQAGARLTYAVTREVAASLRTSSDVGRRGGEVAAGVRVHPVGWLPVWITAERRQRLGSEGGGRNAFAIFAEGGLYQQPLPWQFALDAYLQGGVVGLHSRDLFVDGAMTATRPLFGKFSAGLGVWGGAQPGLYRVDAGPRVSIKVRDNVRVHLDWRQRLAGNAEPGSGPAVTLAADF
jgi:hypothetical protein